LLPECSSKKILVVGDELDMRIFLCNLLGTCGYESMDAADRKEGLQKAKADRPALIILDVMMPKEDGIQMYLELKRDEALRDVPVIMLSTIDQKTFFKFQKFKTLPRMMNLPEPGAYLEKPLEAEELLRWVQTLTAEAEDKR
jgi:CheY-like chemotaxis protein